MLSQRLSLLVKAKGLTQKSIADKMGVSEQALSRYLHGKTAIGADSLEVLLSCLGINVEKLVDAEIAKTMKTQEKRSARRTLTEAFRQLEGAIYIRTSRSPALSKNPREIAPELGITLDELFFYLDLLEAVSLIRRDTNGGYLRMVEALDFRKMGLNKDEQLQNFSLVTAEILSRQTTDGRCWHESSIVYSNKELVLGLLKKLTAVMDEFEQESKRSANRDFLVGISSALVDLFEKQQQGSEQ